MKPVLEVCTHSVESAVSAERGGAMRLELCANLMIGGTSPDEDLFRMVRERVSVPVRVLLRPRCGDFLYTESEFELPRSARTALSSACSRPRAILMRNVWPN